VLGFAFLVSLVTGVLFGTAPAWLSSHAQPAEALRGANRSTRDRSSAAAKALVVFQAAMSLVLLAGAILMTRTLANLEHQNFGIATANRYVCTSIQRARDTRSIVCRDSIARWRIAFCSAGSDGCGHGDL
jgi:hypothetical protein